MKASSRLAGAALAALLAWTQPAWAVEAVGSSLEDLIAVAKAMNPDLQVMALEADAAAARVEGAGSLMDPKVTFQVEGWRRDFPSYAPRSSWEATTKTIRVTQDIPFWGKRDLKREIAEAGARKAAILKQAVENDLVAKVATAYAQYHTTHQAIDLAKGLRARIDTLARLAHARYGQGLGKQQDVTRAEVEKSMLDAEIARLEAERVTTRVRINRLLNRDLDAPLVEAPNLRSVPPRESLDLAALTDRAQSANPELLAEEALIEGADSSVSLAEKSWYPDFEVGVGAMREMGRWQSIRAVGTVQVDERKIHVVAPKFEGYIERLHVNQTGQPVRRGQSLMDIYSPDLVLAQQEYAVALAGARALENASPEARQSAESLADGALMRLKNWDIPAGQVKRLRDGGQPTRTLSLTAPANGVVLEKKALEGMRFMPGEMLYQIADLSTVWVIAEVFEQDLAMVDVGTKATVSFNALPGMKFSGAVTFVYPTVTPETRTAKVRIELPNHHGHLRPALYGAVELSAPVAAGPVVSIPDSAVLDTGKRQAVLVEKGEGL